MIRFLSLLVLGIIMHSLFNFQHNVYAQPQNINKIKVSNTNENDSLKIVKILSIPYDVIIANTAKHIELFEEALKLSDKNKYYNFKAQCYEKISLLKYYQGKYEIALKNQLKALAIYDSADNKLGMASVYSQMGYQEKRRNLDWSIKTMKKGLQIYRDENFLEGIASTVDNLGVLFEMKEDFDSATSCYLESLKIKYKLNDTIGIPYSLNHLAGIYLLQKNYKKAEKYLLQSKYIREKRGDIAGLGENYLNLGTVYKYLNNFNKSVNQLKKAIDISYQIKYPDLRRQAYSQLADVYKLTHQYKKANKFNILFINLNDSLLNEYTGKKLLELQVNYETEKKEKEILKLKEEKAIIDLKIALQKIWIIVLISIAGILITIAIIVVLRIKQLEEKKKHKAILLEKEKGIEAVINAQEEERKHISKELHDGIGQQLSGLKMAWSSFCSKLGSQEKEKIEELTSILNDAYVEVRNISHQMMPRALEELGLVTALEDMLHKTFLHSDIKCEFEHFAVNQRFSENIEIAVYRISQELINNVIKHSGANNVVVQLFKAAGHLILIVEDNGKGIAIKKDFKGHGLLNIATRLDTLHGQVNYEPSPVSGTIATIRIPLEENNDK
ncbi:MAG: tetratricopeptide repeat protein [Chlorobi bacterium]|nr:tetratricopeptide repeat protein [Chlorobiota bacterium]